MTAQIIEVTGFALIATGIFLLAGTGAGLIAAGFALAALATQLEKDNDGSQ